jgi:hypothetical protein
MRPRGEMRIVRVSPKDGWTSFRASDQLLPLAAAREHAYRSIRQQRELIHGIGGLGPLDSEKFSTKESRKF